MEFVRISCGDSFSHVLAGSQAHDLAVNLAKGGLGRSDGAGIRLESDAGPIFWDAIKRRPNAPSHPPYACFSSMTEHGLRILPGEEMRFGKHDKASYNEYADMSWLLQSMSSIIQQGKPSVNGKDQATLNNPSLGSGVAISNSDMSEGQMVLTAWPSCGRILPAKVSETGRKTSLELAEPGPYRHRCFVLDKNGLGVLTASLESDGSDKLRLLNPMAILSWLMSTGSKAMTQKSGRFEAKAKGDGFVIEDKKRHRSYSGKFSRRNHEAELEFLEWSLARHGLAGVVGSYELGRI